MEKYGKLLFPNKTFKRKHYGYIAVGTFTVGQILTIIGIIYGLKAVQLLGIPFLLISFIAIIFYVIDQGITIYEEGIEAYFIVPKDKSLAGLVSGRNIGQKFAKFSDIKSIHPLFYPFNKFRKKEYLGIRIILNGNNSISKSSNENSLITTFYHYRNIDLSKIIPILKNQIGPRWNEVYKSEEPITKNPELFEKKWRDLGL